MHISRIIIVLFPYYGALFCALRPPVEGFFNSPVLANIKIQLEPLIFGTDMLRQCSALEPSGHHGLCQG